MELEPIAGGKVQAVVRRNLGRVYGFEFLSLTAEQTQLVMESCKRLPVYKGNSLGIYARAPHFHSISPPCAPKAGNRPGESERKIVGRSAV